MRSSVQTNATCSQTLLGDFCARLAEDVQTIATCWAIYCKGEYGIEINPEAPATPCAAMVTQQCNIARHAAPNGVEGCCANVLRLFGLPLFQGLF